MHLGKQRYSGVVINFSGSGLFVQTAASARPGDAIEVKIGGAIPLVGEVVWRRKVAPMLRSVASGGVGIRIQNAPEAYYKLLARAASHEQPQLETGTLTPSSLKTKPTPKLGTAVSKPAKRAPLAKKSFRARLKASRGPRSRTLSIEARNTIEAEREALEQAGNGWILLELEEDA